MKYDTGEPEGRGFSLGCLIAFVISSILWAVLVCVGRGLI